VKLVEITQEDKSRLIIAEATNRIDAVPLRSSLMNEETLSPYFNRTNHQSPDASEALSIGD
jgi:hypothetical protein